MQILISDITEANVKDIPESCKACLYWENPRVRAQVKKGKHESKKVYWFLYTLKKFGNCGKILYVDNKPVGYVQYSKADRFPNALEYSSKKLEIAENVAFISCLYINDENFRRRGFGMKLLDSIIGDLKTRRFKAVETFASKTSANNPSGPIEFYLKKGFHVKEDLDSDFALVRKDL